MQDPHEHHQAPPFLLRKQTASYQRWYCRELNNSDQHQEEQTDSSLEEDLTATTHDMDSSRPERGIEASGQSSPLLIMTRTLLASIMEDLDEHPYSREKAGILLGPTSEKHLVTHYIPDQKGHSTSSSFTLHAKSLNRTLRIGLKAGLDCKGIVHAHPPGVLRPSWGDLMYVTKLFANPGNHDALQVMLPIVCNGSFYPYLIDAQHPTSIRDLELLLI